MQRTLAFLAVAALGASGCAAEQDNLGQVDVSLVGRAASGTSYRLRNATLFIDGPGGQRVFNTENDPDATQYDARMQSGAYTLSLSGAWYLERLASDGSQRAEAALLSAHPLSFQVETGGFTPVELRFRAGPDDVDFGEGDVGISIGVDEAPATPQSLIVTPGAVVVPEDGVAQVSVRLVQPITSHVTVAVSASGGDFVVHTPLLTFTPSNHDVAQVVTLRAFHDPDLEDSLGQLTLSAPGIPSLTIPVTIDDQDVQAIVAGDLSTIAEGTSTALPVRLLAAPTGTVTVDVVTDTPALLAAAPAQLTFTASNWQTNQLVTVTALHDIDTAANQASLRLSGPGLADVLFAVDIGDDDLQAIVATPTTMTLDEGTAQTVQVQLAFAPVASTRVIVTSNDTAIAAATPATLTFTASNWNVPQVVAIRGVAPGTAAIVAATPGASTVISIDVRDVGAMSVLGWPVIAGVTQATAPNVLQLLPVDLTQPATLRSLQIAAGATGGPQARLAVYTSAGDRPGTLIVGTAARPLLPAPQPTVELVAATPLPPGRYWIGVILGSSTPLFRGSPSTSVPRCTVPMTFTAPFPVAPSATCATVQAPLAIAATVQL